jgi:DnaJ domain
MSSAASTPAAAGTLEALYILSSPDGYYAYLGIPKPTAATTTAATEPSNAIDSALVQRQYRKLSLKHHPDRAGGHEETFRKLHRAQHVLCHEHLRKQYDILGLDLHDEDAPNDDNEGTAASNKPPEQGIVQELASNVLSGFLQLTVKTILTAVVCVGLVRYFYTTLLALLLLVYVAYSLHQQGRSKQQASRSITTVLMEIASPLLLMAAVLLMHYGGRVRKEAENQAVREWTLLFWLGEALLIGVFCANSLEALLTVELRRWVLPPLAVVAALASLYLAGRWANYATLILVEVVLCLFTVVAFPVMEMILERVVAEKLSRVGEKVRQYHATCQAYYHHQQQQQQQAEAVSANATKPRKHR